VCLFRRGAWRTVQACGAAYDGYKQVKRLILILFVFSFAGTPLLAATHVAASCSRNDVRAAINAANPGDTVQVPAGTCNWTGGLSISGIQLIGAGKSTSGTVITAGAVSMTKHGAHYTRVSGFRFTGSDRHVSVSGSPSNRPYIIDNNYFFTDGGSGSSTLVGISVNGGLLHHNDFTASNPTNADVFNIRTGEDWSQPPTFGIADTTGERNIYFEDNVFTNILETAPDGDVGGRFVIRHNTYRDSSIVFHSSAPVDSGDNSGGTRQFEIYNNVFERVSDSAAINKWIWARGGSGVIANNTMDQAESPDGSSYPNKSEILLTLGCPGAYPMQYQVGQSNRNPENPPSHPLLIFGNTGAGASDRNFLSVAGSGTAGPRCSNADNYIRVNRDYYLSNEWNWVPYAYPHPLQSLTTGSPAPLPVIDTTSPSVPTNPSAASLSSGINLSWTMSTDNVGVVGYLVERCQGAGCTNFVQIATASGNAYSDTGLTSNTTYRYRVRAMDAVGNLSGYSSVVNGTTQAGSGGGNASLPEGQTGIAASFPGDANIQSNANVLFADDFESYTSASELTTRWNSFYQSSNTRIATEAGSRFAGSKALELTLPASSAEVSNAVVKNISPAQDSLFVRVYTKFDSLYQINTQSNHNGIRISAQYPGPGTPPNGRDFFMAMVENSTFYDEAGPGYSHVYVYHPEQRSQWGDIWYPDGRILPFDRTPGDFGPTFVSRQDFIPQQDRWYSYEFMLKANTPGQRDGRIAFWIDGNLMADFQNVRLRDVSTLKIDQIQLELHAQAGGSARPNKKWYDNLVVARSYIGPVSSGTPPATDTTAPAAPTNVYAAAVSSSQINLSWTAGTDNVGVSGYRLERCQDASCTSFSQIAAPTGTSYSDTGLTAGTTYRYRVRAADAAGNLSDYSSAINGTTQSTSPGGGGSGGTGGGSGGGSGGSGGGGTGGGAPSTEPTTRFVISGDGGQSWVTPGETQPLATGYARVEQEGSSSTLSGLAIFGLRPAGILVSEASVPALPPMTSGRIYVEVMGAVNTGVAFANPNSTPVEISFYFTDAERGDFGHASFTLGSSSQKAAFMNEAPFNGGTAMRGSFTFSASQPVGVIAIRGFTNERSDFLMTTLPVSEIGITSSDPVVVPHFADGGGWTTQLVLINPSDTLISGYTQFFSAGSSGQNGSVVDMTVNGVPTSTLYYAIPPRGILRLVTGNSAETTRAGQIRVTPTGAGAPSAVVIFSFKRNGVTVTEAGVPSVPARRSFRMYSETSGHQGDAGLIESGIAIANPTAASVTVTLALVDMNGSAPVQPTTFTMPGNSQMARFTSELFPGLSGNFKGFLQATADAPIGVTGVRGRYNERGDFLVTSTPPGSDEQTPAASRLVFPHIVSGGGFTTRLVVFGRSSSGSLWLTSQNGIILPPISLQQLP
jgi:chitodextrinase